MAYFSLCKFYSIAYERAEKNFYKALKISPKEAGVLNYLAYSWLEKKIRAGIKYCDSLVYFENVSYVYFFC